jgi:hypothetical protein
MTSRQGRFLAGSKAGLERVFCNNEKMVGYLEEVHRMEKVFNGFEVRYVPRLYNRNADHLAWLASSRAPTPPDVIIGKLSKPTVKSV